MMFLLFFFLGATECSNTVPEVKTIFHRVTCPNMKNITDYIDKGMQKISEWMYAPNITLSQIEDKCMNPYEGLDLNDPFYCNNAGGFNKLKQYLAFEFMYAGISGYKADSGFSRSESMRTTLNDNVALFLGNNEVIPKFLPIEKRARYLNGLSSKIKESPLLTTHANEYCEKVVSETDEGSPFMFQVNSAQCDQIQEINRAQGNFSDRRNIESKKNIYFFEPRSGNSFVNTFGATIVDQGNTKATYRGNKDTEYTGFSYNALKKKNLSTFRSHLVGTKNYKKLEANCAALTKLTNKDVSTADVKAAEKKVKSTSSTTTPEMTPQDKTTSKGKASAESASEAESTSISETTSEVAKNDNTEITSEITPISETVIDNNIPSSQTTNPSENLSKNTISLSQLLEILKLFNPGGQVAPSMPVSYAMPTYSPQFVDPTFMPQPSPYGYNPYTYYNPYPSNPSAPNYAPPQQGPQQQGPSMLEILSGVSKLLDGMGQPIQVSL